MHVHAEDGEEWEFVDGADAGASAQSAQSAPREPARTVRQLRCSAAPCVGWDSAGLEPEVCRSLESLGGATIGGRGGVVCKSCDTCWLYVVCMHDRSVLR